MSRILYITYDGLLEPLGRSQVLAYLEGLSEEHDIYIISFEKSGDWEARNACRVVERRVSASNITWFPHRYHKRPSGPATAWDIFAGILHGLWLIPRHGIRILHARSYVPAVIALVLKQATGAKFIFDMRGFWADERLDGGIWPEDGYMYRLAKWFEKKFLLHADYVVSLTHSAVKEIENFPYLEGCMPPVAVIPTCANLEVFRPGNQRRDGFVLGYAGSAGTWYQFDRVIDCFFELRKIVPNSRLLIVNRNEHDYIRDLVLARGLSLYHVDIRSASYDEMPGQIAAMHAGIFFIKQVFSKRASAPTRLAEFLGCGIPCITNSGVGDVVEILGQSGTGVILDERDPDTIRSKLRELVKLAHAPDITCRCREVAQRYFSLETGISKYNDIYMALDR